MRKPFLLLALLATLSTGASAQYQNTLKMNVFGLIVGNYTLSYERVLSDKISAQLTLGYRSGTYSLAAVSEDIKAGGFLVVPEVRYYITTATKDIPEGFYVAPFLRYYSFNTTYEYEDFTLNGDIVNYEGKLSNTAIGGGAVIGYQPILLERVVLDVFIGPQFGSNTWKLEDNDPDTNDEDFEVDFPNIPVRFGVALGVAF